MLKDVVGSVNTDRLVSARHYDGVLFLGAYPVGYEVVDGLADQDRAVRRAGFKQGGDVDVFTDHGVVAADGGGAEAARAAYE